MEIEVEIWTKI